MAKDIAEHGLNPLELLALITLDDTKAGYYVSEGNRRICAIKLLNDPELAPAKHRKTFEKIAENIEAIVGDNLHSISIIQYKQNV